jgi:hypothetical protein
LLSERAPAHSNLERDRKQSLQGSREVLLATVQTLSPEHCRPVYTGLVDSSSRLPNRRRPRAGGAAAATPPALRGPLVQRSVEHGITLALFRPAAAIDTAALASRSPASTAPGQATASAALHEVDRAAAVPLGRGLAGLLRRRNSQTRQRQGQGKHDAHKESAIPSKNGHSAPPRT